MTRPFAWFPGIIALLLLLSAPALSKDAAAVLSAGKGPYASALDGFKKGLGSEAQVIDLSKGMTKVGSDTKAIAAFGAKAALGKYPGGAVLVYTMLPDARIKPKARAGATRKVEMLPEPKALLSLAKELKPGMEALAAFSVSKRYDPYLDDLEKAAQGAGVKLVVKRLAELKDLPRALKSVKGAVQAAWMPPDPLYLSSKNLKVIGSFASFNKIALIGSTSSQAKNGCAASLAPSFEELGKTAGEQCAKALKEELTDRTIYCDKNDLHLNEAASAGAGVELGGKLLKRAVKVIK